MRTFVIFPAHARKEIEASSPEAAIRKYRKTNQIEAGNLIYAVNKVNVYSELESLEQGAVITETPKPEVTACDPEDMKPANKDVN